MPQLRELEALLFDEMLQHLWWRVVLPAVANDAQQGRAEGGAAGDLAKRSSSSSSSGGSRSNGRSQRLALDLQQGAATLQGTLRSFESAEVGASSPVPLQPAAHAGRAGLAAPFC